MNNTTEISTWNLELKNYLKDFSYDAGLPIIILIICCILLWLCIGKKITKILVTFSTFLIVIFCFKKTPEIISKPLLFENNKNEKLVKVDNLIIPQKLPACVQAAKAIIVLGAGVYQENLPGINTQLRLLGLSQLFKKMDKNELIKLQMPIVFTGGYTNKNVHQSEANAMKIFLNYFYTKKNELNIITENESKNTYQNSAFCHELFEKYKIEKKVVLITNDFHMFRAKRTFEKQGFQVCPLSILSYETEGSGVFNFSNALSSVSLMNEYVGIIGYVWKGWLKI